MNTPCPPQPQFGPFASIAFNTAAKRRHTGRTGSAPNTAGGLESSHFLSLVHRYAATLVAFPGGGLANQDGGRGCGGARPVVTSSPLKLAVHWLRVSAVIAEFNFGGYWYTR